MRCAVSDHLSPSHHSLRILPLLLLPPSGFQTSLGQSWKRRWFRVAGADVNYSVKMVGGERERGRRKEGEGEGKREREIKREMMRGRIVSKGLHK